MNRHCMVLVITLTFFLVHHPAHADGSRLFLDTLVEEAIAQNPEIKAIRHRWEAAEAIAPQVRTLPDPIIGFGYRGNDIMNEGRLALEQEIPFPGKLRLKSEVAAKRAKQTGEFYQAVRLRVVARLKETYFNLHFIHKSIEIVQKNLMILKEFEKTAEARYKVGKGIQQDVFRAQVELSREIERLADLDQRKESVQADVNRILNRPPSAPLGVPEEPTLTPIGYTLEELNQLATKRSPLLNAQRQGIAQGESSVDLALREYYPDFIVSLGAMQSFRFEDQRDVSGLLGIRVPLYYSTKQRYGVKEARASLESVRRDFETVRQDVLFRIKDNMARAKRAERLVKLIGQAIIPQASLALESSLAGYAVGTVDFLTMLDNLLRLQQDELDLHREKADHEIAVAKLEEAVGIPLGEETR